MTETGGSFLLQQLSHQWPTLLVYLFGVILSCINLRRYPGAAFLAMLSCGLLFAVALGVTGIQAYLWQGRTDGAWSVERVAQAMSLVGGIGNVIHAGAIGLLIVAVFFGRRREQHAH